MDKPELYSKGDSTVTINKVALDKYGHLIKWGNVPESIFESGIGDGKVTREVIIPRLPENIKEYIGSDLSQQMLDFCKAQINFPKFQTFQMDICTEEIPQEYQNRFEKVFASLLLHMLSSNLRQVFILSK